MCAVHCRKTEVISRYPRKKNPTINYQGSRIYHTKAQQNWAGSNNARSPWCTNVLFLLVVVVFVFELALRTHIKGPSSCKVWAMQSGKIRLHGGIRHLLCDCSMWLGPFNDHMSLYGKRDINERGFNFRIPPFIHSFTCNTKGHRTQQPVCQYILSSNTDKAELPSSTFSHPCILVTTV